MTVVRNKVTRTYEADIRDGLVGRVHLSLRTKRKGEADERHAAVAALIRQGNPELIHRLRKRQIRVEAVTRLHQANRPFEELLASSSRWPTLGAARDAYLAWVKKHPKRAANTYRNAEHYLRRAIDEHLGADLPLELVTHERIEELRTWVATLNLKDWSGGQILVRLNALFNWMQREERRRAAAEHRVPRVLLNPIDPDVVPKPGPGRTRFLSKEEATALLSATPDAFRFAMCAGLFAGLRIDEMRNLRPPPHDIDLSVGTIIVQPRETPNPWTPKNKKRREIGIQARLIPVVEHHLARYASDLWMCPSPYVPAQPMGDDLVGRTLKRIVEDAGLTYGRDTPDGITYHTLRHTFASWMVMEGTDLKTVATLLGHSTTRMVEVTYGHLAKDHKRRAVERLGADIPMAALMGEAV